MPLDLDKIETKLAAARTRLILDKPFLGALVLRLPLQAANPDWCPTTATDARGFFYNAEYIDALSIEQTQFMLAHEALHCALSHFARRQHRIKHRWDLACDFAINPLLVEDGLRPPPNALILDAYKGMTAEEIYPLIDDQLDQEPLDTHAYDRDQGQDQGQSRHRLREDQLAQSGQPRQERDPEQSQGGAQPQAGANAEQPAGEGGADSPPPLTPAEQETLSIQWQQRLAGAAQQALQAGKLGGALARMVDHLLQPQLPWRTLLAHYLSALARDDYSYMRPSRREGDFILPSLRSHQVDLVVALDTSGSIKQPEIDEFLAELDALKGQLRARITFLPCDASLAEGAPWVFEPWETFACPESLAGGGGTDFRPVFHWVEGQDLRPDLLLYFTDGDGAFPPQPPNYPVLWLVKGKHPAPWGQRVQLN
jgi:predicted metal-dependent peptidase